MNTARSPPGRMGECPGEPERKEISPPCTTTERCDNERTPKYLLEQKADAALVVNDKNYLP